MVLVHKHSTVIFDDGTPLGKVVEQLKKAHPEDWQEYRVVEAAKCCRDKSKS